MSRTWKWVLGIAAVLIVAGLLVVGIFIGRIVTAGNSVEAEIARIKAAGEPVSAADLSGKPIPDSENGAVVYEKCFAYLPRSDNSAELNVLGDFLDPSKRAADPALRTKSRAILARYAPALPLAEKAAVLPRCRFPVEWQKGLDAEFPHLWRIRYLARALQAQSVLDAENGDSATAARHLRLAFQMSDSLKDEPGLISQLVRYACVAIATYGLQECLGTADMDERSARDLSAAIVRVDLSGSLRTAFLGERATGVLAFDQMRTGQAQVLGKDEEQTLRRFYNGPPGSMWLSSDEMYYLREMKLWLRLQSMPCRELRARHLDVDPDPPRYALMSAIILPLLSRTNAARDRAIANLAGSRIFLGLVVYCDRFGSYPLGLADLKKLNWQLPEDPFSGKRFVYRRQGKGFVLYSIGDDLKDNGGTEPESVSNPNAHSKWPGKAVESDIVWKRDR